MNEVYVGLGSNQDFPEQQVLQAFTEIAAIQNTTLLARSSLYLTKPWGIIEQNDFINAVVKLQTTLTALELFEALITIEKAHSRVRGIRNGPRTLDCDLLLFGQASIATDILTVPHPGLTARATVLVPLVEIAPSLLINGKPISFYLQQCDLSGVKKYANEVV
jgi:2-amino-4-hydroxy-6-hydroxymethyldihydropteridine diphosphokinase